KGQLKRIDGMAPIDEVTAAIGRALAETAFRDVPAKASKGGSKKPVAKGKAKAGPAPKAKAKAKPSKAATKAARDKGKSAGRAASAKQGKAPKSHGKAARRRLTK